MRAFSSAVSVGSHIGVVMLALLGTTRRPATAGSAKEPPIIVFPSERRVETREAIVAPSGPDITFTVTDLPIDVSIPLPQTNAPVGAGNPLPTSTFSGTTGTGTFWSPFAETTPEVLSGPLPRYPELLRQAGVEGRVVLEATVDTSGRVGPGSILVAEATNPAFVGPAKEALLATLFRPGAVNGRAVRVKVRIPYEFTVRDGTGRAR